VGVAVEMVPISVAFQKLFLLPVYSLPLWFLAAGRYRHCDRRVAHGWKYRALCSNVGGISFTTSGICTYGFTAAILDFRLPVSSVNTYCKVNQNFSRAAERRKPHQKA
jgi:hypothetical protein